MEPHPLGVSAPTQAQIESVRPEYLRQGLLAARKKSWEIFDKARVAFQVGMTEGDARAILEGLFREVGVERHWHRPWARFGPGTALTFFDPLQSDYRLKEGDPVYMDLGPVFREETTGLEYEGDVGATYVVGENPIARRCADTARYLFEEGGRLWKSKSLTGTELYAWMKSHAQNLGYELLEKIDGHRVSDYPHVKYSKARLSQMPFRPSPDLWILELQIVDRQNGIGAFYEDILGDLT